MKELRDDEKAMFNRMVDDAMRVFGYGRTKAESMAKKLIVSFRKRAHRQAQAGRKAARKADGGKKRPSPLTKEEIARLPPIVPPPRNAKERVQWALGPDPGERRRRDGSPLLQGGGPGLGRRR